MVRLMDHLEIDDAHVAGYSVGAEVALRLAAEHPERLRSLVVAGSGWSDPAKEGEVYSGVAMGLAEQPHHPRPRAGRHARGHAPGAARLPVRVDEAHRIDLDYDGTAGLAGVAGSMGDVLGLTEADLATLDVPVPRVAARTTTSDPTSSAWRASCRTSTSCSSRRDRRSDPWLDHLGAVLDPMFKSSIVEFLSQRSSEM